MIVNWAFKEYRCALSHPASCQHCGCSGWQSWSRPREKKIRDPRQKVVPVKRWRCKGCGSTITVRPEGVTKSPQSPRLKAIVGLLYVLGLSYRGVSTALAAFGLQLSHVSGWRDVQELGELLRHRPQGQARIVGIDETYVKLKGKSTAIGLAIDMGNGHLLWLEVIETRKPARYLAWLRCCAERLGAKVIVSDDSVDYRVPVEEVGLAHQLCLVHVKRTIARKLGKLSQEEREAYRDTIDRLRGWMKELPLEVPQGLWGMLKQELPQKLRWLVVYLLDNWHKMVLYRRDAAVPATNNNTEQAIARSKVRYKTTRGLKSRAGVLNFFTVTQDLYSHPWQVRVPA